jgi:hypothetical protein
MNRIIGFVFCILLTPFISVAQSPAENNIEEPLFHLSETRGVTGTIDQVQAFDYGVLAVWRDKHHDQTFLSKFSYDGDLIWERRFENKENLSIAVSESSNSIFVKTPIPWEDEYNTGLRKCNYKVLNRRGQINNEFIIDCTGITPIGDYGWLLLQYEQDSKTIYNYQTEEYFEGLDRLTNLTALPDDNLIMFKGIWEDINQKATSIDRNNSERNRQSNRVRPKLDSLLIITLNITDKNIRTQTNALELPERFNYGHSFDSQQVEFEPFTNTIGWSSRFIVEMEPYRKYDSKLLFMNRNGKVKSIYSSASTIEYFSFVDSSTVLIFLNHRNPLKPDEPSKIITLYDFNTDEVIWETENDFFKNYTPKTFNVSGDIDFDLLHGKIKPSHSCKTDIITIELTSGDLACLPLFIETGPLYHPELIQLSETENRFLIINSKRDKLFFASINQKTKN